MIFDRQTLIARGVRNLREFGYLSVDENNILTDEIYSRMFRSILQDNMGHSRAADSELQKLIKEIDGG